jgi:tetratricopeptide (TPR) repeat protein
MNRAFALLGLLLAPAALAANGSAPVATPATPATLRSDLVLVATFENGSEDRSLYWLGEAISDGLSRSIRECAGVAVERVERVTLREEMGVPTLSTLTLATQIRSAEELGAALLVTGDFKAKGDALTVRARVVDVAAARTGAWMSVNGSVSAVLALQDALFHKLQSSLPVARSCAAAPSAEDGVPQAAYEMLLKSYLEDAPAKREKFLKRALELAPDYLRARIELALLYREQNALPKASTILSNIVTRNPALAAQAQNLLGENELDLQHAAAAEAALRRSLVLQETARAHLLLGKLALARNDLESATRELERSRAMDPSDLELLELEDSLSKAR